MRDTRVRLVRGTQDGGAGRGGLVLTLKGQLGNDQLGARKIEHGGESFLHIAGRVVEGGGMDTSKGHTRWRSTEGSLFSH